MLGLADRGNIFDLMDAILNQIQFELSQQKKEKLWSKDL